MANTLNTLSMMYMLGRAGWSVYSLITAPPDGGIEPPDYPYRPEEWQGWERDAKSDDASLVSIIDNNISAKQKMSDGSEITVGYFFDAFVREDHYGAVRITEHPVQDGASMNDHAYNLPDRLSLEILMSDVMDEVIMGRWQDYETKSISAYQKLRELKESRAIVSVVTRLHNYDSMLIETISVNDDYKQMNSLRCTVALRQIITAYVAKQVVKIKSQVVKQTKKATQNTTSTRSDSTVLKNMTGKKTSAEQRLRNSYNLQTP